MFETIPANTPELQMEAHRLRYQVYCLEHNFEDPTDNPNGLERDEFDDHAIQGLLLHRPTGMTVGTVRLVLPKPGATQGSLPIHQVCTHPTVHDPNIMPLESTFELSRFAISKTFRRRVGDGTFGRVEDRDELQHDARRIIPHITLGLMTLALQMGIAHGIETVCAVMEPALLRLVAKLELFFNPVGPLIEYHGWRQPCYADVATLLDGVARKQPDVWDVITDCGRLLPATGMHPSYSLREAV